MSQVKNISKKYGLNPDDEKILSLRKLLNNHMGYFQKMSEWVFGKSDTTIEEISNIIDLLKIVKINKPITSFRTSEQLYDHICEIQNKRKMNQIIKSIPSRSRSNVSVRIKNLIYNNLDREEELKDFFSKKGGTCKTEDDLYQRTFEIINLSKGGTDYRSVLKRIKRKIFYTNLISILKIILPYNLVNIIRNWKNSQPGEIVYKDGKTIIVKINTFSLSVVLGSKHWCISRSLNYWNNYTKDKRTQYFIFQTNIKGSRSVIGITIQPYSNNVYAAHLKDDTRPMDHEYEKYLPYLKGFDGVPDTLEELIKYEIYNIKELLLIKRWERIFNMIEFEKHLLKLSYEISKKEHDKESKKLIKEFMSKSLVMSNFLSIPNIILSYFVDNNEDYNKDQNNRLTFSKLGFLIIKNGYDNMTSQELKFNSHLIIKEVDKVIEKNKPFKLKWGDKSINEKHILFQRLCEETKHQKKYGLFKSSKF